MAKKLNLNHPLGTPYFFSLRLKYTKNVKWLQSYCEVTNTSMNKVIAEAIDEWVESRKNNIDIFSQEVNEEKVELEKTFQLKQVELEKEFQLKLQSLEQRQQLINETLY